MAEDESNLQFLAQNDLSMCTSSPLPVSAATASCSSLKRPASPTFDADVQDADTSSRKRFKASDPSVDDPDMQSNTTESKLEDDIALELECGCCSELVYKPVVVSPCQHFFCGSCCQLWIRNGGNTCPVCRSISTTALPSRPLQRIIDALLRNAPHKARAQREREQADEIYNTGSTLRFPSPREASPEPNVNISADYVRPCPHCSPNNPYGWTCPAPIPDPVSDLDHAWHVDDGIPSGHSQCGNCETYLALHAPSTSRCDFCFVSFCGVNVPQRCSAVSIPLQHPQGFNDMGDLIQSPEVYDRFQSNTVEVEIMLDYLAEQEITPRHIYREIIKHVGDQPRQFQTLRDQDLFHTDAHIDPNIDTAPLSQATPTKICRGCAGEIFIWGLQEWWIRERKKGFLEPSVMDRKDCREGAECNRQKDFAHAKEFNHIICRPAPAVETPDPLSSNHLPDVMMVVVAEAETSGSAVDV